MKTSRWIVGFLALALGGCGQPSSPTGVSTVSNASSSSAASPNTDESSPLVQNPSPAEVDFLPEPDELEAALTALKMEPSLAWATPKESGMKVLMGVEGAGSSGPKVEIVERFTDWKLFANIEQLSTEISASLDAASTNLKKQSEFDRNLSEIRDQANLVIMYSGVIAFRDDAEKIAGIAAEIQDEAMLLVESASGKGRKNLDASRGAHQTLTELLAKLTKGRGSASDLEPYDWSEMSEIDSIMRRVEAAFKRINGGLAKPDAFESNVPEIELEAAILATLTEVSAHIRASQPRFVRMADDLKNATLEELAAVRANDFAKAKEAVSKIDLSCKTCHEAYRFRKKKSEFDF